MMGIQSYKPTIPVCTVHSMTGKVKDENDKDDGAQLKNDKDDGNEYKVEKSQEKAKMTMYNDSNWNEVNEIENRELEVKYTRKHNQSQLQRAIEKVKRGANEYLRDLFTDVDPAGNYTNYVPHLNRLKITPQLVHNL